MQPAFIIVICIGVLTLVLATAGANGIIVFNGSSADLSALLFLAATLVLTGVGVFVALLALWGRQEIRDRAVKLAIREAVKEARKVAKNTATSVAARIALEAARPGGVNAADADEIAQNLGDDDEQPAGK